MICNFICIFAKKKIERYIISPIHPKLEIMRNKVASINELAVIVTDDTKHINRAKI